MSRQRISLISNEVRESNELRNLIEQKKINSNNFSNLSEEEQNKVKDILFEMSASNINLAQGLSGLEFVLFSFIRLMNKKANGLSLSAEDKKIESKLQRILELHEITLSEKSMDEWCMDYLSYAEKATLKTIQNRQDHVSRKMSVTGSND